MEKLREYFGEGIDHLMDDEVLAVRKRINGIVNTMLFLSFIVACGHRRLKMLFVTEKVSAEEKTVPAISAETFSFMTDDEIAKAIQALGESAGVDFIVAMQFAGGSVAKRLDGVTHKMVAEELAAHEAAKAEIARKAQEDADRARKDAAEKAESERQAAEVKRLSDEKTARENALREAKEQVEREAKFRQYVMREIFGTRDIVQLASRKLEKIKEFRGPNGITPEWQLAIIRDVAWRHEGELRKTPSFLPTDKVGLEAYITKFDEERKDLQPSTSKVITGAYERQLELARKVLSDLNEGKVIRFPDGGRDGASDAASTEAAQKRAERETRREERRERDRALRVAAKTPSQGGGKKH